MCFPPHLPDLRASLPEQLWVNRALPTLPRYTPHIRFLFVRLVLCHRLPPSKSLPFATCRVAGPSPVRADSGLSPHRHTCVAGRSYKMPALLSDSGHSVFAYAKSYRGPSPGRYEPEQVTPSTFCCHPSAVTTGSRETNPSGLGLAAALGVEISGGILFKDRTVRIRYFAVIAHAAHFR